MATVNSSVVQDTLIPSVNTTNQLFENKYAYILGSAQSGKTSLAKMMYLRAVRQGLFPVYLYGSDIASTKPESLQLLVERALRRQISKVHKEEFWQAPQDQRFIVVDDFNGVKVNSQAKQIVTEWLKKIFGYVFIISGERTQLEDIVFQNREGEPFRGFKRYDIRSFGYHLRDVIIEKWLTLGEKRHFLEYEELHHQIRSTADTINRILGRNLLPAYPVFIFIILQQLDADIPIETTSGSYGYFYEMLITTSLRQVSRSPDDVDAKYTYLAHFAWFLFRSNGKVCDSEALSKFTKNHCEEYGLVDDPEMLKREVLSSRLVVFINGQYRFAYRYLYYYFIARYMRDNYDSSETEALIGRAIGELHREDYSNVLVFLTYLTKKKSIMELLLEKSRSLMTSIEPCDLSEHVAFISRLQDQLPGIMVDDEDPIKSRAKIFQAIDASSSGDEEAESAPSFDEKHEEKAERESFFAQYRMSARLLQVIGQILRNFSGSLKRDMKVGIAKECLDIGFKRLNLQYRAVENNIDRALTFIQELSSKSIEHMDDQERKEFASKCLLLVTEWMCFTALAEISSAIGSEQLIRTYEDLDHRHNTRALKFAQLYIRLEHFREFPEKKVFELFDDVKNDIFGLTLLRLMVGEHFYLFPRPERIKQRVCSRLGITLQSVHRLTAIAKV